MHLSSEEMNPTEKSLESDSTESGLITVQTQTGQTLDLFILSSEDFNELRPRERDYRRVATMLENEPHKSPPAKTLSKKETSFRIQQIVRGQTAP